MDITGAQVDLLSRLLDVASLRHRVVANNVANVNTPGYRRLELNFEDAFQRAIAKNEAGKLNPRHLKVAEGSADSERADGNTVDIGREMGRLDQNTLIYRTFAQILAVRLAALRSAITGR
jgi:flagellar basal-body rod protein FlgB